MMETQKLTDGFRNPGPIYRPAPLWVWNDEMTKAQIDFQLRELASHGFGGAFVHPRPGLVTEYLSDAWFSLWEYALGVAKQLGIKLYIYDENSYPSGFGGGHVSALCPDAITSYAKYAVTADPAAVSGDRLAVYAVRETGGKLQCLAELTAVPPREWKEYGDLFVVITTEKQKPIEWMGGFAYVDLMRPEAHKAFMDTTYEAYYRRFGKDFGGAVPAIFTDEPSVGNFGKSMLPFSFWFAHEFRRRNGYDLEKI